MPSLVKKWKSRLGKVRGFNICTGDNWPNKEQRKWLVLVHWLYPWRTCTESSHFPFILVRDPHRKRGKKGSLPSKHQHQSHISWTPRKRKEMCYKFQFLPSLVFFEGGLYTSIIHCIYPVFPGRYDIRSRVPQIYPVPWYLQLLGC